MPHHYLNCIGLGIINYTYNTNIYKEGCHRYVYFVLMGYVPTPNRHEVQYSPNILLISKSLQSVYKPPVMGLAMYTTHMRQDSKVWQALTVKSTNFSKDWNVVQRNFVTF